MDKEKTGFKTFNTSGLCFPDKHYMVDPLTRLEEVFELLDRHGEATGQVFPLEVKEEIFRLTAGQPWLTNALARQMVLKILKYDFSKKITMDLLEQAKNQFKDVTHKGKKITIVGV